MVQPPRSSSVPRLITPQAGVVIIGVILLVAFGLRLWDLNAPSIWHDEGWSIRAIRDPIGTPDDKTPLAYYSLIHVLWNGAGETPLALRYGSVLLDVLTIAVAVRLVRQWATWDAAIMVAALLCCSPLLWVYAREIRAYAAVPLLTLILLGGAERILNGPTDKVIWRVWGVVLLAELILLYTHNLSVPVVAWLNLVLGSVWLVQRRWHLLAHWIGAQCVLFIAYLPWLLDQPRSGTAINSPPKLGSTLLGDIWQGYFAPLPRMLGAETPLVLGGIAFAVLALLSLAALIMWRWDRRAQLVLSQAVLLPVLSTVEILVANIDFHPRYYVVSLPATMLIIALGIDSIPEIDLRRGASLGVLALASGVGLTSIVLLHDDPDYQHDDFRALSEYYATLPDDAIILIPYGWEPAIEEYYADKLPIRAEILGIDLHSSADETITALNAALAKRTGPVHVEAMTWFQLPADLRGMYPCVLSTAGQLVDTFTAQGLTTTAYRIDHPVNFVDVSTASVDYSAISLTGTATAGEQSVCMRTNWTLPQPTGDDWRVAARLVITDPPGWIIAHSDTDIRADDQTPTSLWDTEQRGTAFSLLNFPAGAPPGDYDIQVIVFSNDQLDGLDRLVNGVPAGKVLPLLTRQFTPTIAAVPDQPTLHMISSAPAVELIEHDATDQPLNAGQELRITLHWRAAANCCASEPWIGTELVLRGDDWQVTQPVAVYSPYSLDWHALRVPAEVSGTAELVLVSGEDEFPLATYTIEPTDHLFDPPVFDIAMQTEFTGLAWLEGFSVANPAITPDETLTLTLIWRVKQTQAESYRVFTHLLDPANNVIAQHDDYPVGGTRLTTSWVRDEYIEDTYQLVFDPEFSAYRGLARLEVGFYDPATGNRIRVANGADHIILPIEIMVQ